MNETSVFSVQTREKNKGRVLLLVVAALQAVSALLLLLFSGPGTFEADTGVAWADLSRAFPTVAAQFSMVQRASLVATLSVGLFSLLVTYFPFRDGQRWAWFAMWILPASMAPGIWSLLFTENQAAVGVFGMVILLVAMAGLLVSYRNFFSRRV